MTADAITPTGTASARCPACTAAVGPADRYCEACGQDLAALVASTVELPLLPGGRWLTSAVAATACGGCGGTEFSAEGYCDSCGQRRSVSRDHTELDLGSLAAATDRGHRHHRNEDAVGLGGLADTLLAIVCDGVSSSSRPDTASTGAVVAATQAMVGALRRGDSTVDAIGLATRAAQAAATLAAGAEPGPNPPASTFVCAVVTPASVTVGWVGDSRVYWVPDDGQDPACLTVDDSVAGRALARGMSLPPGISASQAGALLRWLGADATDTRPHVRAFTPSGPGRVLVCSDGLFKYRPAPAQLAAATPNDPPLQTVRALVQLALDAGGQDNISVAVLPYPPEPMNPPVPSEESTP